MRKQLLLGTLTAFGLGLTTQAAAQEAPYKCGTHEMMKKLYAENPEMKAERDALLEQFKQVEFTGEQTRVTYIIPIVFHILHQYGVENIDDSQVYDQMEILNEDFGMDNADLSAVVVPFDTIIGDATIEFRLATIDPMGNCTNGIEHIYDHNAFQGDEFSKIHQWNRAKYLNVWVVDKIVDPSGAAGYAVQPAGTEGVSFWRDGIVILHDYVGSIGTSNATRSRALTHEAGHWLGLDHTWGGDNDPGVLSSCNQDDGIQDTPNCIGQTTCNLSANTCDDTEDPNNYSMWNFDVIDNVQNFMEYSYCSNMFTKGQVTFMHNVLAQVTGQRNNLYTEDNLIATGTAELPGATCIPVADFAPDERMICVGEEVTWEDASWKAEVDSYQWTFPGGTPSSSTDEDPEVTYANPGYYSATLTVTNAVGSHTKTWNNALFVSAPWPDFIGPYSEDFEDTPDWWLTLDMGNPHSKFQRVLNKGKDLSACYMLNNYKEGAGDMAEAFTNDWYYYNRMGGAKDALISPAFDLSTTSNIVVSFDYAYGTRSSTLDGITEKLVVSVSKDCGKTWVPRLTVEAEDLVSAGYVGATNFAPSNNNMWRTATFNYTANAQDKKTRVKFEFIASDNASNLYIDNINISGVLGVNDAEEMTSVSISPNPVASGSEVAVEIGATDKDLELQLVDVNGQIISTTPVAASGNGTQTVMIPMNVSQGCYFLYAVQGNARSTYRVIVF